MIGTGPDYYNGINREEDKRVKLGDEVQAWWDNLDDDNYKFELLECYYPGKAHLMGLTEMFEALDWQDRLDIYREAEGK